MKYEIQRLGELLRVKSIEKSLHHIKTIDFAFCFFFLLDESRHLLNKMEFHTPGKIDEYLENLRNRSLSQSLLYNSSVDYSFSFFYAIDELKEFLSAQDITETRKFILKNWL